MCTSDIKEAGRLFASSLLMKSDTNMQFMIRMLEETEKVMKYNESISTQAANQLRLTRNLLRKVKGLLNPNS